MLCWLADNLKVNHTAENVTQFEEIVNNFESEANNFSVLRDECSSLMNVVWLINNLKHWWLSTVANILNIIQLLKHLLAAQTS